MSALRKQPEAVKLPRPMTQAQRSARGLGRHENADDLRCDPRLADDQREARREGAPAPPLAHTRAADSVDGADAGGVSVGRASTSIVSTSSTESNRRMLSAPL